MPRPLQSAAEARRLRRREHSEQVAVAALDLLVAFGLWIAADASADALGIATPPFATTAVFAAVLGVVGTLTLALTGHYERERILGEGKLRRFEQLFAPALATAWVAQLVAHTLFDISVPWNVVGPYGVVLAFGWFAARNGYLRAAPRTERIIIVGTGVVAEQVVDLLNRHENNHVEVVGFVAERPRPMASGLPSVIGRVADLPRLTAEHRIDRIIVAYSDQPDTDSLDALRRSSRSGVRMQVVPRFFDLMGHHVRPTTIGPLGLVAVAGTERPVISAMGKRLFDLVVATVTLVLLSPLLATVAVVVRLQDGGPVLFRQQRIGRDGKPFNILKFRTMVENAHDLGMERIAGLDSGDLTLSEAVDQLKPEQDSRVTRIGAFLRASSLDELPQLINVIRGQMSLVGPRPLCDWEAERLEDWQDARHGLRPGITGHWQTMGRSDVSWDARMQMDFTYVRHWSLREDFRILTRTVAVALGRGRGAR